MILFELEFVLLTLTWLFSTSSGRRLDIIFVHLEAV